MELYRARVILDAVSDPNRYAALGIHSHATPSHQAALGGHLDAVRLLVERRARTDTRDIHHNATPLEWARYGGQSDVTDFLEPICAMGPAPAAHPPRGRL